MPGDVGTADRPMLGVVFQGITTISLGGGEGSTAHIVNDIGSAATTGAIKRTFLRYPA